VQLVPDANLPHKDKKHFLNYKIIFAKFGQMTPKQLQNYADAEVAKLRLFFSVPRKLPSRVGCESIPDSDKTIKAALERLKQPAKSADFKATIIRLKMYRAIIENA